MRLTLKHMFGALALYAGAFGLGITLSAPAAAASWSPNDDDAVLFDARLGQYRLGNGIRGYQTPAGVCLDLADTIMALDVPVRLDKKLRRATGWIFEEESSLTIDREQNIEQIKNNRAKLAADAIYDTPEGWCVDAKVASRWFGITMTPDLGNAILMIKAPKKLPVELAAERKARGAKIRPVASFDLKSLPNSSAPYHGVKWPSVDAVVSIGGLRERGGQKQTHVNYELYASGEIGPVAYDARLASSRHGVPETLRLRAYRTDPDGGLLGPAKATQVAVGDVTGFTTPLASRSSIGRGAMITNRPLNRPDVFSKTDFRGELPIGWDAELYRNGQLLAFAIDRADGRYEFLDVPLQFGQNRFEVVLYGPQGQIRREERSVAVGADSIPPKTSYYWAGINQDGRDLIGLGKPETTVGNGAWRGTVGLERGLNAKTSVLFAVNSLGLEKVGRRNFAETAVRRALGPALLEVGGATDFHGGYAFEGQLLGQMGQTYFSAQSARAWNGFRSDRFERDIVGIHSVSVDQSIKLGRTTIPAHVEANYLERDGGDSTLLLKSRLSAGLGRYNITTEFDWERNRNPFGPNPPDRFDGKLLVNGRIGPVRVRGESRFRLSSGVRFEAINLTGEWSGKGDVDREANWRAEIGYDRTLNRARLGLGYVRRFEKVALTGQVEAATDGSVAAGLNLSFSLGRDPRRKGGYRMSSDRLAAMGQVMARVYRDSNADGIRQADEPFEKDVQLAAGRIPVHDLTDGNGEVVINELMPYVPVLIGIDASSLPDPLIQPVGPGIVVTPRPGVAAVIELALTSAGEVDGTLVADGGTPIEGVDLELVDSTGHVLAVTRSDFDGFFLFEKVPYGKYSIRIAKLSADAARLAPTLAAAITVNGKDPSFHLGALVAKGSNVQTARGQGP